MKKKHRYLIARYIMKPRDPTKTHVKGYISDPANQKFDEVVGFTVGLQNRDHVENQIIIDIDGQKVIKNTMSDNQDWSQLMDYFMNGYEKQLITFMKQTGGIQEDLSQNTQVSS